MSPIIHVEAPTTILHIRANLDCDYPALTPAPGLATSLDASAEYMATYDPSDPARNFSNGAVTENVLSMKTTVLDALGVGHELRISFGRVAHCSWVVEVYLPQNVDGIYDVAMSNVVPGQITYGQLFFNGNGCLTTIIGAISSPMIVNWNNGAMSSALTINWGGINGMGMDGEHAPPSITQIHYYDEPLHIVEGETNWELVGVADHA